MYGEVQQAKRLPAVLARSTLGVVLISIFLLTPFALNNFLQGRYVLGIGTLLIVGFCLVNSWYCGNGRYPTSVNLFGMVPTVIVFLVLGLVELEVRGTFWCFLGILSFWLMLREHHAWIASIVLVVVSAWVAWVYLDRDVVLRFIPLLVTTCLFAGIFVRVVSRQQDRLREQAVTDPLTGLYNRMLLEDSLSEAIKQYQRVGTPMTLVMFDLDRFKAINDDLGHEAGDEVLAAVADLMQRSFRQEDRLFRSGGEEFMALMFNSDEVQGFEFTEQFRVDVGQLKLLDDRELSISAGVAGLGDDSDWQAWIKRCDRYLYEAKTSGRNRVVAGSSSLP